MVLVVVLVATLAVGCAGTPSSMMRPRPTCSPPSSLPGQTVFVMLGDTGMARMMSGAAPAVTPLTLQAVPARVPAGVISFVVRNMGLRTHEMVVLPLPDGRAAGRRETTGDGRVDEAGSLGEASASCAAGSGEGIAAGTAGWVTLDLRPGRYELVCNLRDHYVDGMHHLFTVS